MYVHRMHEETCKREAHVSTALIKRKFSRSPTM